mgnify:FL=1
MKVLYVTTVSSTMNFFVDHIRMLLEAGHSVDLACNWSRPANPLFIEWGCQFFDICLSRNPVSLSNTRAYVELKNVIRNGGYDVVHTHTPIASALVRIICRKLKHIKILYTAHGFHFYKGAPAKNWLLYFPLEWWLSRYTDILITINSEDYDRAKRLLKAKQVRYIPGVGLDTRRFANVVVDRAKKRRELGVPSDAFVVLSVGELNTNKNHAVIIKALAKLKDPNIYYLICGKGPLDDYLRRLAAELDVERQVKLLGFRKDIAEICKVADVFAFPSLREGLGLAALEAMASGLPIITSNVHGIVDYSEDGRTGFSYTPTDVSGFAEGISRLKSCGEGLRSDIGAYNRQVAKKFDIAHVLELMRELYEEILS